MSSKNSSKLNVPEAKAVIAVEYDTSSKRSADVICS